MICIKGIWERADTLEECIKIAEEYIGSEYAEQLKVLTGSKDVKEEIKDLLSLLRDMDTDITVAIGRVEDMC